jgi:hypothetical protein
MSDDRTRKDNILSWATELKLGTKSEMTQQYNKRLGLREIKLVELWKKYRPFVPEKYHEECCPKPTKVILDGEKNRKNAKRKLKREAKKKNEGKLKSAPSPQIVAAQQIVAATTNDRQELTNHETFGNATARSSPSTRSSEDA